MSKKKELNEKELEKVSGGTVPREYRHYLSGELSTSQAYQHVGENLFFFNENGQNIYYCKLNKCWEDYGLFHLWSYTRYDVEIIEATGSNESYWGPGCKQSLNSKQFKVYTNYSGPRPLSNVLGSF